MDHHFLRPNRCKSFKEFFSSNSYNIKTILPLESTIKTTGNASNFNSNSNIGNDSSVSKSSLKSVDATLPLNASTVSFIKTETKLKTKNGKSGSETETDGKSDKSGNETDSENDRVRSDKRDIIKRDKNVKIINKSQTQKMKREERGKRSKSETVYRISNSSSMSSLLKSSFDSGLPASVASSSSSLNHLTPPDSLGSKRKSIGEIPFQTPEMIRAAQTHSDSSWTADHNSPSRAMGNSVRIQQNKLKMILKGLNLREKCVANPILIELLESQTRIYDIDPRKIEEKQKKRFKSNVHRRNLIDFIIKPVFEFNLNLIFRLFIITIVTWTLCSLQ